MPFAWSEQRHSDVNFRSDTPIGDGESLYVSRHTLHNVKKRPLFGTLRNDTTPENEPNITIFFSPDWVSALSTTDIHSSISKSFIFKHGNLREVFV